MARKPRRWIPGAFWFVTIRCIRSEYRLRPDEERKHLIGYWLARAQARHPGVRLLACVQMSNHIHLIVQDQLGELSRFMEYSLGHLAKDINRLDGVRGPLFERRFTPIETIDQEALLDRIAYALTNPVTARLVRRRGDWPGLLLVGRDAKETVRQRYRRLRRGDFQRARERARRLRLSPPARTDFIEHAELQLELSDGLTESAVRAAVDARAESVRAQLKHSAVLGRRRALAQSPFARPKSSKRSARPLCHASSKELWLAYLDGWRRFVRKYREASELFRSGVANAPFPEYSYRPSTRVVDST